MFWVGPENVITYEKTGWLQLVKGFNCRVTSTWVDANGLGECHTCRGWGSRIRNEQINYITGPRDLQSTTYLNKTRLRTWDHFPVAVKIDGKKLKVKKGKKGWAWWNPQN